MKKVNYLFVAVISTALIFTSCKKKEETPAPVNSGPEQVQNSVSIYFGGTWCGPCGAYGKPAKESLHNTFGNKSVIISCQVNGGVADPMNNADANKFATGFGVNSVPIMYLGGHNDLIQGVGGSTTMSTTITNTTNTILAKTAVAASSLDVKVNGSTLTIDTKTKFFENQTEEYYVGVYLLESGLNYTQYQDASTNKNIHDNVLRKIVSTATFGDLLSSNFKSGDIVDKSFTATIDAAWKSENMSVALILWRKNTDGKMTICNGTVKDL